MREQSTSKGFAILSAAGMLVKVLSLLYIPFLLRIIGKDGYGIYASAYSIYAFIYVITNTGIPVAISKMVSELTAVKNYRDAVKGFKIARFMLLLLGTLTSILTLIFAYPLAKITHSEMSYLAILALAPTLFFTSIASAYRGYFQGRGNMTPTAVSQVIEQIINTVFTLVFAAILMRYSVQAGCAGGTIGTSLGALFSALYLVIYYERHKKFRVPKGSVDIEVERFSTNQLVRRIINYGVPITLCIGLTYAGNLVDLWNIKSRLAVAGFSVFDQNVAFGTLTKYQQLLNVPIAIVSALSAAILPAISSAVALKNRQGAKNGINYAFKTCFLIAVPSAFGLAVLSKPIFNLLFTAEYADGSKLMLYGSIVLVLMSLVQIQTTILQSLGKLYISTLFLVLGIIAKVVTNYVMIAVPQVNILGAVFGSIVGYLIPLILNNIIIVKSLKIKFRFVAHSVKPVVASAFMSIVVFIVQYDLNYLFDFVKKGYLSNAIATAVAIGAGGIVYLYSLILIGGINQNDLSSLPARMVALIPSKMRARIR